MLALVFHPRTEKNLLAIPKKTRLAILTELGTLRTMDHPLEHRRAKKLRGIGNSYRIRVGDYRILTELKDATHLLILDIRNRQAGY